MLVLDGMLPWISLIILVLIASILFVDAAAEPASVLPKAEWRLAADGALSVFATSNYPAGALVERCYSVPTHYNRWGDLVRPYLYVPDLNVSALPSDADTETVMALFAWGWCTLYNNFAASSGVPNLDWKEEIVLDGKGKSRHFIDIVATRPLVSGEELIIRRRHNDSTNAHSRDIASLLLFSSLRESGQALREEKDSPEAVISGSIHPMWGPGNIEMRFSPMHGCGIFAARDFLFGEIIEVSPMIHLSPAQIGDNLKDYRFNSFDENISAVSLGFGSVYNHADHPNVHYAEASTLGDAPGAFRYSHMLTAARDISAGDELFINYGESWWNGTKVSMPSDRHPGGTPNRLWQASAEDGTLGVYAQRNFFVGEEVERCLYHTEKASAIPGEVLRRSLYTKGDDELIFPYGWCLLYNEVLDKPESEATVSWDLVHDESDGLQYLIMRAARPIFFGEELTAVRNQVRQVRIVQGEPRVRDMVGRALERVGQHVKVPGHQGSRFGGTHRGRKEIEDGVLYPPSPNDLDVRPDPHMPGAYRLYALRDFRKWDILEASPALILHYPEISESMEGLCYQTFHKDACLIMLSVVGAVVGHQEDPSMEYYVIHPEEASAGQRFTVSFSMVRDVKTGDELSINYESNGNLLNTRAEL